MKAFVIRSDASTGHTTTDVRYSTRSAKLGYDRSILASPFAH